MAVTGLNLNQLDAQRIPPGNRSDGAGPSEPALGFRAKFLSKNFSFKKFGLFSEEINRWTTGTEGKPVKGFIK